MILRGWSCGDRAGIGEERRRVQDTLKVHGLLRICCFLTFGHREDMQLKRTHLLATAYYIVMGLLLVCFIFLPSERTSLIRFSSWPYPPPPRGDIMWGRMV